MPSAQMECEGWHTGNVGHRILRPPLCRLSSSASDLSCLGDGIAALHVCVSSGESESAVGQHHNDGLAPPAIGSPHSISMG